MRHYTNPMDSLSQCRVALQDAYQEIVDCKAKLAALVEAMEEVRDDAERGVCPDDIYEFAVEALAAAKVQP